MSRSAVWHWAAAEGARARTLLAAVLFGAVAALGQAPFDLWPLAMLGLAGVFVMICAASTTGRAALIGLAGGAGWFAVSLHWIVEPFFVDAARHGWMAPFALILFALGMALFWAGAAGLVARALPPGIARAPAFLGALTLAEAARATVLSGFPWAQPGHALIGSPWLAFAAPVAGDLGLTLIVLAFAALWAALLLIRHGWLFAGLSAPLLFLPLAFPEPAQLPGAPEAPLVRLVQPNAPQHLKWDPAMIPVFWERGLALTGGQDAAPDAPAPALVIWPETSLPVLLGRSDAARARLSAAAGPAQVLIGAQRIEGIAGRNALAHLGPDGALLAIYDKHHLVPFGEYTPAGDLLRRIGLRGLAEVLPGGYTPGPGPVTWDLGPALGRVFPMICYEAIFPGYVRQVAERPDWLAHVTNDAWFGTFSGPWQHLALARLRAAEQGLPVLRAANTGISAVIDARGRVLSALPLDTAGALDAALPPALPPTLYSRTGPWPALALAAIVALWPVTWRRMTGRH